MPNLMSMMLNNSDVTSEERKKKLQEVLNSNVYRKELEKMNQYYLDKNWGGINPERLRFLYCVCDEDYLKDAQDHVDLFNFQQRAVYEERLYISRSERIEIKMKRDKELGKTHLNNKEGVALLEDRKRYKIAYEWEVLARAKYKLFLEKEGINNKENNRPLKDSIPMKPDGTLMSIDEFVDNFKASSDYKQLIEHSLKHKLDRHHAKRIGHLRCSYQMPISAIKTIPDAKE